MSHNKSNIANWWPILMYHRVTTESDISGLGITPVRFEQQLAFLRRAGYQNLPLTRLAEHLTTGQPLPARSVVLTFDDGYQDNYLYAWPLLKKYGFGATIFVVSDFVGLDTRFDRERPANLKPAPMLTADQIRQMAAEGIEFGSHTATHQPLPSLGEEERASELSRSRHDLSALLDRDVTSFAYPYSRTDESCEAAVAAAGYSLAVAGKGPHFDRYRLNRIDPVELNRATLAFKLSRTVREIRKTPLYGRVRHGVYVAASRLSWH